MIALDPAPTIDAARMTKMQKLAALLIILGPDTAAQILRTLSPSELETVSAEMTRLPAITPELREQILSEMSEVALTAGTALRGGVDFAQQALEKAVGASKASDIIERVTPVQVGAGPMGRITDIEPRLLFNLLRNEHPQTIALVASYLRTEICSELLGLLGDDLREQVIERLATLEPVPVEVVEVVGNAIERRGGDRGVTAA